MAGAPVLPYARPWSIEVPLRAALLLVTLVFAAAAHGAQPIAIETLFRVPEYSSLRLSPDGAYLAALVPQNGHRNLAIIDLDKKEARSITRYGDMDVVSYAWLSDRRLMIDLGEIRDASGLIHYTGFGAVDIDGKDEHRTRFGTRSVIYRFADGDVLRVGRHGTSSAVFRANTRTGSEHLVTLENPGNVTRWVADWDGNVRAALSYDRDTRSSALHWRPTADGAWKELARFPGDQNESIVPIAFEGDNRGLIVSSNIGSDRRAIYRYDPESAKLLDKLFESREFDLGGAILERKSRKVLGIASGDTPSGVTWLDPHWRDLQAGIDKALPGLRNRLAIGDANPDRVLVTSYSDVQPERYWLLDAKAGRLSELLKSRGWIDPGTMTPVKRVTYKARDGLDIPAHLAVPPREAPGKPPLIVIIHGGPHVPGHGLFFDAEVQFLTSRGYAVLLPDFRGTEGYGRKFLEAGYRQWGRAMQDDITDGVKWAASQGLVDGSRVCLYGWSYGGYAALMGLVREPGMFRCAVAAVAVTDPQLLFEPGWNRSVARDDVEAYLKRTIGDPDKDRAMLDAASPLKQAKVIKAPVLLAFGGADPRVPLVHGTRLRSALEDNGTPVEWVMYPDEAHGFNKDENRFDFYRRVEAFLARNLGP